MAQVGQLSPSHSTLAQELRCRKIAESGSLNLAQRLSWKIVAESGSPHSTGNPLEEGSRVGSPHSSEAQLEEGSWAWHTRNGSETQLEESS